MSIGMDPLRASSAVSPSPPSGNGGNPPKGTAAPDSQVKNGKAVGETKLAYSLLSNQGKEVEKKEALDEKALKDAVEFTNRGLASLSHSLLFSIDKDTDKLVVKVIDTQSKEVIKQFPSEEMLEVVRALDKLKGMLVRDQA